MPGTRHSRLERAGAVVVAALLVCSMVAAVAGVGSAHGGDHVTRNGDTLEITLGAQHFDGDNRNVTVSAAGGSVDRNASAGAGEATYSVPVARLSEPQTDLSNASVTVKPQNGSAVTEHENLQLLTFDGSASAKLSGATLELPVTQALGYADGGGADARLDGETGPVDATVEYRNGTDVLAASLAPDRLDLPLEQSATIQVSNGNSTDVNLRSLVTGATEIERDGNETVVVNPFVVADTDYDLVVTTENPTGTYAATVTASGTELAVTDEALASAGALSVSAYHGGDPLFEDASPEGGETETMTATVASNGTAVNFSDESLSADGATLLMHVVDEESAAVNATVSVENGTLDLSGTDYRLHPNGSYRLMLAGDRFVRAEIDGPEPDNSTLSYAPADSSTGESGDAANADGDSGGTFAAVPGGLLGVAAIAGTLVVLGAGAGIALIRKRRTPSVTTGSSAPPAAATDPSVTVTVEDAGTGTNLDAKVTATAKNNFTNGHQDTEETTVSDGAGSLTLERGTWILEAETGGVTEQKTVNVRGDKQVGFEFGPKKARVSVTDDDGEPLSDIPVTATLDNGDSRTERTDDRGRVGLSVPFAATEVEVSADHEKYESDAATLSLGGSAPVEDSLTLRQLTGRLDVTATVEGTPVAGLPVEIRPEEDAVAELGGTHRATTDESGVATFDDLLVGTYEARLEFSGGGNAFSAQSKRVEVRDGGRTRETLDSPFEFTLGRAERDRITSIRQDVESLAAASGRDVAVPRYYGSVVTALVDTVERTSRQGHRFATADADPDAVVAALLDAAEEAVELIHTAMTTKRNTDLFGACADMPDEWVEWSGSFDADALFELLEDDRTSQRQTVLQRLRAVDDRIDRERSDLAVVAPARELWDGVKEFVNSERGDDRVRGAAVAFVAIGLLDGVDELFDHDELRSRLERTVF
ncbi:carboxypeptidase-like regulatory domain-containing protein [Halorussus amylolyticus]|uniref:carboxypeptidase-like regulatory domain-containing protein n=1 Tax=Halorussus amylolyticus TaxID=1126242 RepID=UPI001047B746|nr:carboxypeptidase-like regulatory domain-containing protein [Halorussus amylolyticus]